MYRNTSEGIWDIGVGADKGSRVASASPGLPSSSVGWNTEPVRRDPLEWSGGNARCSDGRSLVVDPPNG